VLCITMGEAPKAPPITGIAGRYISMAKGPRQDKSPKINAGRAKEPDMGNLSEQMAAQLTARPCKGKPALALLLAQG